jgi:hypothetical protein
MEGHCMAAKDREKYMINRAMRREKWLDFIWKISKMEIHIKDT